MPGKTINARLTDTVKGAGGRAFSGKIEQVGDFRLHAEGQFAGLDGRFDGAVGFRGQHRAAVLVHGLDQVELSPLLAGGELRVADVAHAGVGGTFSARSDARSLVDRRQECAAVIGCARLGRRADADESGKVVVGLAQTVENPGPHRGANETGAAGVQLGESLRVIGDVRPHGVDHAEPVGLAGEVWEEFTHPEA